MKIMCIFIANLLLNFFFFYKKIISKDDRQAHLVTCVKFLPWYFTRVNRVHRDSITLYSNKCIHVEREREKQHCVKKQGEESDVLLDWLA